MIQFINENFTWTLILVLLVNMNQRRLPHSDKKRIATIYLAFLFLLFYIGNIVIGIMKLSPFLLLLDLAIVIGIGYLFRSKVWPFRLHCTKCSKKMSYNHIIGYDENLCDDCYKSEHPEEFKKEEIEEEEKESGEKLWLNADKVDLIDWDDWEVTDSCVITYIKDNDKLLLIEKKQGLGKGYYNAPGGHIESTETAIEAAIREVKEETGLDIADLEYRGKLHFNFKDGMREVGYVFFTSSFTGELKECDEARPFWTDANNIPFENMWEDDKIWLERALKGEHFKAYFIFDDKKMLDYKIEWNEE